MFQYEPVVSFHNSVNAPDNKWLLPTKLNTFKSGVGREMNSMQPTFSGPQVAEEFLELNKLTK